MKGAIVLMILLSPLTALTQKKAKPLIVSVFNEATAIPFTRFISTPLHPGVQVGTEFNYNITGGKRLFQTINIGYYFHNHLNQAITFNSDFGYEHRLKNGIAISGLGGLGYLHSFNTRDEFVFDDGSYIRKNDEGNARVYASVALDGGYYIIPDDLLSPKLFIRYQAWVEYPFSTGFIPVMTHINLHLGVKVFISKR